MGQPAPIGQSEPPTDADTKEEETAATGVEDVDFGTDLMDETAAGTDDADSAAAGAGGADSAAAESVKKELEMKDEEQGDQTKQDRESVGQPTPTDTARLGSPSNELLAFSLPHSEVSIEERMTLNELRDFTMDELEGVAALETPDAGVQRLNITASDPVFSERDFDVRNAYMKKLRESKPLGTTSRQVVYSATTSTAPCHFRVRNVPGYTHAKVSWFRGQYGFVRGGKGKGKNRADWEPQGSFWRQDTEPSNISMWTLPKQDVRGEPITAGSVYEIAASDVLLDGLPNFAYLGDVAAIEKHFDLISHRIVGHLRWTPGKMPPRKANSKFALCPDGTMSLVSLLQPQNVHWAMWAEPLCALCALAVSVHDRKQRWHLVVRRGCRETDPEFTGRDRIVGARALDGHGYTIDFDAGHWRLLDQTEHPIVHHSTKSCHLPSILLSGLCPQGDKESRSVGQPTPTPEERYKDGNRDTIMTSPVPSGFPGSTCRPQEKFDIEIFIDRLAHIREFPQAKWYLTDDGCTVTQWPIPAHCFQSVRTVPFGLRAAQCREAESAGQPAPGSKGANAPVRGKTIFHRTETMLPTGYTCRVAKAPSCTWLSCSHCRGEVRPGCLVCPRCFSPTEGQAQPNKILRFFVAAAVTTAEIQQMRRTNYDYLLARRAQRLRLGFPVSLEAVDAAPKPDASSSVGQPAPEVYGRALTEEQILAEREELGAIDSILGTGRQSAARRRSATKQEEKRVKKAARRAATQGTGTGSVASRAAHDPLFAVQAAATSLPLSEVVPEADAALAAQPLPKGKGKDSDKGKGKGGKDIGKGKGKGKGQKGKGKW